MGRHNESQLRGGAEAQQDLHVDRRQAQQVAERVAAVDDIGLPVHPAPAVEGWW